jgi:hypothetical protein
MSCLSMPLFISAEGTLSLFLHSNFDPGPQVHLYACLSPLSKHDLKLICGKTPLTWSFFFILHSLNILPSQIQYLLNESMNKLFCAYLHWWCAIPYILWHSNIWAVTLCHFPC